MVCRVSTEIGVGYRRKRIGEGVGEAYGIKVCDVTEDLAMVGKSEIF